VLTGIHVLLTYKCILECDHCFVYSSPNAGGTFTLSQMRKVLAEASQIGTIEWIYFEGGEPFLFYPLLLESIKIAHSMGFRTGVVTNAYYAISEEDTALWLRPLCELGVLDLSVSDDSFHHEDEKDNPAKRALDAARRMGMPADSICTEKPTVEDKGTPIVGGDVRFRGRAAEKLVEGLPTRGWEGFTECPYEDLEDPGRVHLDPYGNVHLCQGLSMGNMWETPLSMLVKSYHAGSHPICGPLVRGGPALLATEYDVKHADRYVDACHFCYLTRLALVERFPQYLTPRQVYGLE
jgi:hypothetical protein